MTELRCDNHTLLGIITEKGLIEVACHNKLCGKIPGTVVLHRFDPETGQLVETLVFKQMRKDKDASQ